MKEEGREEGEKGMRDEKREGREGGTGNTDHRTKGEHIATAPRVLSETVLCSNLATVL